MKKVKLKSYKEIDFNKWSGSSHLKFELLKKELGQRIFLAYDYYNSYGTIKFFLKDLKGRDILSNGEKRPFCGYNFKEIKPCSTK